MDKRLICEKIEPTVAGRGCFLVDASVSPDNDICLTIERIDGSVDMDDCVAVSEAFQALFDRDAEDYALTVTSAGLDQPFKVLRQFEKALGSQVEVRLRGGRKLIATLTAASAESISVSYTARETVGKKKQDVPREETFAMGEVNSVRPYITFDE